MLGLGLSPYIVAEAFYNGELEDELRRVGMLYYSFKMDSDRDVCMEKIEMIRRVSCYPHCERDCMADCKARGMTELAMYYYS